MTTSGVVPSSLSSDMTESGMRSMDPLLVGDAPGVGSSYLVDESPGLKLESKSITMSIHGAHLSIKDVRNPNKSLNINLNDIVGTQIFSKHGGKSGEGSPSKLCVYWYPRKTAWCSSSERRTRRCTTITYPNIDTCTKWCNAINRMARGLPLWSGASGTSGEVEPAPTRRFIVVLNPFSGKVSLWMSILIELDHNAFPRYPD
jgi:hypothetical protein